MLQIRLWVTSCEVSGLVAAKSSWVDPTTFETMELDTHLLYSTKLSRKFLDFNFLVGTHLSSIYYASLTIPVTLMVERRNTYFTTRLCYKKMTKQDYRNRYFPTSEQRTDCGSHWHSIRHAITNGQLFCHSPCVISCSWKCLYGGVEGPPRFFFSTSYYHIRMTW